MGFRANRRIAGWTYDLNRWALQQEKQYDSKSAEYLYALGVQIAVLVATGKTPAFDMNVTSHDLKTREGFADARALITKVMASGNAPQGDFAVLLGRPWGEPL